MSRVDDALEEYRKGSIPHYLYASTAASEYAKLRDETPITEDWAAKLEALKHNRYRVYMNHDRLEGKWYAQIMDGDWSEFVGYVTTRGQVRSLLLAAGIEVEA